MIEPNLFLAFVVAVTVLMLIPGPDVALITANSVTYGPRFGLLTVAGTSSAVIIQLFLTGLGMTELLGTLGVWFDWLRWVGVGYLIYLGVSHWRAPVTDLTSVNAEPKSAQAIYARAFLVSLTNPKTLFFYGAFFPQFISRNSDTGTQIAMLSVTFLALAILVDGGWALLAARVRWLLAKHGRFRNRLTGGLLIGAGTALAIARNK